VNNALNNSKLSARNWVPRTTHARLPSRNRAFSFPAPPIPRVTFSALCHSEQREESWVLGALINTQDFSLPLEMTAQSNALSNKGAVKE